jgi:glucan phosphoethanolaminetransferase (alkaline phosphatase superfamily)
MHMIDWFKGLFVNFILSAILLGLFVLPDYLFQAVSLGYQATFGTKVAIGLYLITLFALASHSIKAIKFVAIFFALLQLGQFFHFSYFGTLISPHAVVILFTDFDEISESLFADMTMVLLPIVIVSAVYGFIFWLLGKIDSYRQPVPLFGLMLFLVLAMGPVKAYNSSGSQTFYPNPRHYSIKNTYYAISYFLGKDLPSRIMGRDMPSFEQYRLEKQPLDKAFNLIVIMGESVNPSHMSLFGFDRETTPKLKALLKDPNFVASKAISGGVNTKVAVQTFFNLKREPANVQHLFRQEANLMAMAKGQGMTTHYISAQTANLATYMGDGQIDHFFSREDDEARVLEKHDAILIDRLQQVDLSKPNYIVIHQRGSHTPYDKFHPDSFDRFPEDVEDRLVKRQNSYHNSLFFTDHVTVELINVLKKKSTLPAYLVFTSDHGELQGENGLFGHTHLVPEGSEIPFIFYAINGDQGVVQKARDLWLPTHYEVGEFIAEIMGYKVINPNARDGEYYVNGIDIDGSAGHILVKKTPDKKIEWTVVKK